MVFWLSWKNPFEGLEQDIRENLNPWYIEALLEPKNSKLVWTAIMAVLVWILFSKE